jgi:DNA-binding Lrp family transcriptional regulator
MGRIKINEIDKGRFYQLSKELFLNEKYKSMKLTSKVLYALLNDRLELSRKNNWFDENGDVYLKFSREHIEELLCISHPTACNAFKELVKHGLIDDVHIGINKANKIYIEHMELETVATTLTSKNLTSRSKEFLPQEVKNFNTSDTKSIKTNLIDISCAISKTIDAKEIVSSDVNYIWSLYPSKLGKASAIAKIPKLLKEYGKEKLELCIKNYITHVETERSGKFDLHYQNGSTFFNGGYIDFLEPLQEAKSNAWDNMKL